MHAYIYVYCIMHEGLYLAGKHSWVHFILILHSALCWIAFLSFSLVLSSFYSIILLSSVGIFMLNSDWRRPNSVVLSIWKSVCVFHRSKPWRLRNWICWESKIWLSTQSFNRDVQNRRASWRRGMISTHSCRYFSTCSLFRSHRKAFATIKHSMTE